MDHRLTRAEAILHRTGPNNITVLFETRSGFNAARAFRGVQMLADGAERFRTPLIAGLRSHFGTPAPVDWTQHVCVVEDPLAATSAIVMDTARILALPPDRPLWRAVLVNPDGAGWSGLVLHFDHAIADGTRISRHIVTNVRPAEDETTSTDGLPRMSFAQLQTDPRLAPAASGQCRLPFAALRAAVPEATSHSDALLRLGRRMLDAVPDLAPTPTRRKDHATVAKIQALQSGGLLGNHAMMEEVDLSQPSLMGQAALFRPRRMPLIEALRMAAAGLIPASILRGIVQTEFSRPGIVLTIVPVSRKPPPLFGLALTAIHPAAPALGRPPLAITATRMGDGFDVCITAHGPNGDSVPTLSTRVAAAMVQALQ